PVDQARGVSPAIRAQGTGHAFRRELEMFTGGQEIILALDTRAVWTEEAFESAVVATASLYFYAQRRGLTASLWTPETGAIRSDRLVLEALAAVLPNTPSKSPPLPKLPLIWLTSEPHGISALPVGSRWLLWAMEGSASSPSSTHTGQLILPNEPLQVQLQASVN
ncbi:MAG: hypothetical protein AAFY26_26625, partial [Cyanobacteria bacterium J06638_22]